MTRNFLTYSPGFTLAIIGSIVYAQENIDCPKGSFPFRFESKVSKTTNVWCNKNENGNFIKVGKEYTVLPSGEFKLLTDHTPNIPTKDVSAFSKSGTYKGDFSGNCSELGIDGHFEATVNSNYEVSGAFKSSTTNLPFPVGGPITGKVSNEGALNASGKAILDCQWIGQIKQSEKNFVANGTWKCSLGGAAACDGTWQGRLITL